MLPLPTRVGPNPEQKRHFLSFGTRNMFRAVCKVLLIEDDTVNAKVIRRFLSKPGHSSLAENTSFEVNIANSLATGIEQLAGGDFDVVLLDLMLPDSQGLNTLVRLLEQNPAIPVVVQTSSEDRTLVVKAFQLGAHGYLPKRDLDSNLLVYAIRLAIERRMQMSLLEATKQQQQREREFLELEQLANAASTSVTARLFGSSPLRESLPDFFLELVQRYGELMDLALEQQAYRVEHNVSEQLRALAERLGLLKAGPRDVVDIHTKALKQKTQDIPVAKAQAYVAEGRLMVLELMGYLTSFYRKYYIGLSNINITP